MADGDFYQDREKINESWAEWLDAFRKEIYPTFGQRGIPFKEAVMLYRMNLLFNRIEPMQNPGEPDEPWKA